MIRSSEDKTNISNGPNMLAKDTASAACIGCVIFDEFRKTKWVFVVKATK